ncbi:MAG: hypothetical protein FOGNACKC_00937 [Anaerolineae bacterium]|nr:hypothetical protein [Anaerolineae bacterium]
MYIQQHFSEILAVLYPNAGVSAQGLNIVSWANPPDPAPSAEWLIKQLQTPGSAEYKKYWQRKLTEYLTQTPVTFKTFVDGVIPPDLQPIYLEQQKEIDRWEFRGADIDALPLAITEEWATDKSQREMASDPGGDYVPVEAAGVIFKCRNAADLFNSWRLNADFWIYLWSTCKPIRSHTDYLLKTYAPTTDDPLGEWTEFCETQIAQLPGAYMGKLLQYGAGRLPGKIAEFGLEPVG